MKEKEKEKDYFKFFILKENEKYKIYKINDEVNYDKQTKFIIISLTPYFEIKFNNKYIIFWSFGMNN